MQYYLVGYHSNVQVSCLARLLLLLLLQIDLKRDGDCIPRMCVCMSFCCSYCNNRNNIFSAIVFHFTIVNSEEIDVNCCCRRIMNEFPSSEMLYVHTVGVRLVELACCGARLSY